VTGPPGTTGARRAAAESAAAVPKPPDLRLRVNLDSPVPPYEQLRSQVARLVAVGALTAGTRLPSVRQLAGDLGIAPGTVARAYRELEDQGVVAGRGRHGTVVTPAAEPSADARRRQALSAAAEYLATTARELGFSAAEAHAAARQAITEALP
jgi:GntR family transcriptional regulator